MSAAEPEQIVLTVGAPAHGGHCVARPLDDPQGPVIFVRHALPGETVRAVITQRTARVRRAEAIEILEPSPDRVRPLWAQAGPGGVGGGELSHVALPAQRTWKRWVLADCLRRIGGAELAGTVARLPEAAHAGGTVAVEAMPSEQEAEASESRGRRQYAGTGTRTRVSVTVTPTGRAGMHVFHSDELQEVSSLPLAVPEIQALGLTEGHRWRHVLRPGLRVSAVAPSEGEPVVIVGDQCYTAAARPSSRRRVTERVEAAGLGLGTLRYSVHASGFWQVHRDAPSVLVDRVVRAVLEQAPTASGSQSGPCLDPGAGSGHRVLELYSGAGLFTLPLVALGAEVHSLEGSTTAVKDARRTLHGFPGAQLSAGRVTPEAVAERGAGADVVVLDPPRQGAGRQVVEAVARLGAQRLVMVSCDPASLARDLGTLLRSGYLPAAMSALDMFPHTHHLEMITVLERV